MTQAEYRNTYSWQGAIDLGPKLVSLSEDLPVHEQTGLLMQLHELMVEVPAMVAADLVDGTSLRFAPLYRLTASLELIERVYPALDASMARHELDELSLRLSGPSFNEMIAKPIQHQEAPEELTVSQEPQPREAAPDHTNVPISHDEPSEPVHDQEPEPRSAQDHSQPIPAMTPLIPTSSAVSAAPQPLQVTSKQYDEAKRIQDAAPFVS